MESGKILTIPKNEFINEYINVDDWWYNKYHNESNYNTLDNIGLDINYNKYSNHGIEIRFFDYINDNQKLKESFEFIIFLMDSILENDQEDDIKNPIFDKNWNNLVYNCLKFGKDYIMTLNEINLFKEMFNNIIINNNN
jgi:hypothetical protein